MATGLAVTAVGGDVLFIEATAYPGDGRLQVTGQLGDVMQESAQTAHSWARAHAVQLGIDAAWFGSHDVHVHVPAGAVPKDGPSAGITIATAIVSLAIGRPVSEEVGMTGEITLTGQVLPIGGVRDKVLAAQRAGLGTVVLPRENEPDLEQLPAEARKTSRSCSRTRWSRCSSRPSRARRSGRGRSSRASARPPARRAERPQVSRNEATARSQNSLSWPDGQRQRIWYSDRPRSTKTTRWSKSSPSRVNDVA